ncbi:MAG TPA: hypothetical protein VGN63_13195 [Flavisolibacter sp.]|jgi:hypothetical protein|nr:hypothetical protein [Flavisolibacter sp.]
MKGKVLAAWDQQLRKPPVATVPQNFQAAKYYRFLPMLRKDTIAARDSFHVILSALMSAFGMPNFLDDNGYQEPRPLSTEFLKAVLGNDYCAYVDVLVNHDVIQLVSMQGQGRARRYLLGPHYRNQPLKLRPYKCERIRRQLRKAHREHLLSLKKLYMAYSPLIYHTWSPDLQLDEAGALTYYQTFLTQLLTHA